MKYTKILGIALLVCGITLLSCGQQTGETQGPDPQQAAKAEIATPSAIIPLEQAQVYYDRYGSRRAEWGLYINNGKAGYLGLDLKPADPKALGMEWQLEERSEARMFPSLPITTQGGGGSLIMNEGTSAPPPYN